MFVVLTEKAKKNFEQTLRSACIKGQVFPTDETFEAFIKDSIDCYDTIGRDNPIKAVKLPDTFFQLNKVLLKINPKDQQAATHELASRPELLFEKNGISVPQAVPHSTPDRRKKPPITIDHVRTAVIHHVTKNNGALPKSSSNLIEEGNPLYDGKRTWRAIDVAISQELFGLTNTGFVSLLQFCKTDEGVRQFTKHQFTIDQLRAGVIHHVTKNNGMPPKSSSNLIEEGNPLHDGERTWAAVDKLIKRGEIDIENHAFSSLFSFCKTDEDVRNVITPKTTLHTPESAPKKPSIQTCRAGDAAEKGGTDHKNYSLNPHFNYNSIVDTMVAHTNATKSQPDPRDTSPIEHGPLANGVLAWSNVAFAIQKHSTKLAWPTPNTPTDLNTLFETAVLPRPDVVRHFALPLPPEMQDASPVLKKKKREKKSPAPSDTLTVVVTFR